MIASRNCNKTTLGWESADTNNAMPESCVMRASDETDTAQTNGQVAGDSSWLKKPLKLMLGSPSIPKKLEAPSKLLALPRELRDQVFGYLLPTASYQTRPGLQKYRPELRTRLWRVNMTKQPWGYENFSYLPSVPKRHRLDHAYLLINHQIHEEILDLYFRRSKFELHAELKNTKEDPMRFIYSPQLPSLYFLEHMTHCHLWVHWTRIVKVNEQYDELGVVSGLLQTIDKLLELLQVIETIRVSVSFSWKRAGKYVALSVEDRCDLMEVFNGHAEARWLQRLRVRSPRYKTQDYDGGVGYKIYSRREGHREKGGEMDVYVSIILEDFMDEKKRRLIANEDSRETSPPLFLPQRWRISTANLVYLARLVLPWWRGLSTQGAVQ
ncbi:hypothetical protein AOQ84DRAFT_353643 [Glonium stellatum]|uniref:F-box domain-containing protein n=1 Tax=Glonium stellatum TaxID=574774 RepID=A0A8E2JUJ4_9PEZI|nr:hypothetical protein AOQ84DRAFT_353643 [Glonium stellatum]